MPNGPLLVDSGMPNGPLLVDCGMGEGSLLVGGSPHGMSHGALLANSGMAECSLLSGGGSGRSTPSWRHHGRTMVPLGPDRSNKNTA